MDYDLWDVTVDDSASNGVLLSEKICTLFCFCGFGRGLIERQLGGFAGEEETVLPNVREGTCQFRRGW